MRRYRFVLLVGFCSLPHFSQAATINAANCSAAAIQTAINSAVFGDTVAVPAGNCTWTTAWSVPEGKRLIIRGAGIGATNITFPEAAGKVMLNTSDSDVTGFSIQSPDRADDSVWFQVNGDGGWRIHANAFTNASTANNICFSVIAENGTSNHPVGVFDHNTFTNCRIYVKGDQNLWRGVIWNTPTGWGTNNGVFVETNTFNYNRNQGNCLDVQYSGRYIARFNTLTGCPFEAHGLQNGQGTRSWEIYNNNWVSAGNNPAFATFLRGGTGIAFSNTFHADYAVAFKLDDPHIVEVRAEGVCDGRSPIDGNIIPAGQPGAGWPCRDQIGRGVDAFLFPAGLTPPFPSQASEPAVFFLNRKGGVQAAVEPRGTPVAGGTMADYIADCRDYQNERASFNGSCGTGVGTIANRPGTCTEGVYYWATNEGEWNSAHSGADGQLYKCTERNTWTLHYKPYVYPHPRVSGIPLPPSACDLNRNGSTTVHDVQLCTNQVLGVVPCTTGDINRDGNCTTLDLQRVVNAVLGGICVAP